MWQNWHFLLTSQITECFDDVFGVRVCYKSVGNGVNIKYIDSCSTADLASAEVYILGREIIVLVSPLNAFMGQLANSYFLWISFGLFINTEVTIKVVLEAIENFVSVKLDTSSLICGFQCNVLFLTSKS